MHGRHNQGCRSMLSIEGYNLQFYTNFALFSTLGGGMNLDHDFVQESKLSEDKKKTIFTKNGTPFSPNSSRHLRSDAHQSQIIGGNADVDHTQTIGGIQSNSWGIYPPMPPGFHTPGHNVHFEVLFQGRKNPFTATCCRKAAGCAPLIWLNLGIFLPF